MKVHFQKGLFRISALLFILLTVFLAISFLWKWMDIPKTPDPAIWKGFPKEEIWRKFFSFSVPLLYGLFTLSYAVLSRLIPPESDKYLDELYRFRRYDFLTYALLPLFLLMMLLWRHLGDWYLWFGGFYLSVVFIKTAILSKVIYRWIGLIENPSPKSSPQRGEEVMKEIPSSFTGEEVMKVSSHGGEEVIKIPSLPEGEEAIKGIPSPLRGEGKACPRSYQSRGEGAYIRWGLFLTSFLLYASVSLWINYSIPPAGDEPHYLMITHSLLYDRDFDLRNNIEQGDHRRFSWVYFPMHSLMERNGGLYSTAYNILCLLLIPGYALGSILPDYAMGGRLGSLLTINLITVWLLSEIFLFTAEISKSYRAAFISWAIVGFTSPVFFFSSQVYPEIAGAFVLVFTLRRLLNPDFKRKELLVITSMLALISLKMRFIPIALTLPVLWAFISSQKKKLFRILWTGIATVGFALAVIFIDKTFLDGILLYKYFGGLGGMLRVLIIDINDISAFSGLLFDQEFGLIFYSPLYTFGLIGIPWFFSRYRREGLGIILPVLIYIFVIINLAGAHWFGGWALPSRLIVVITPLIGLIAGIILSERRGLITVIIIRSLWIWSICIVFIMSLVTIWRYNSANGANILLRQIEELFSTRITRLFPSFISPTPEGLIVFAGLLVFFILASILILRKQPLSVSPNPPFNKPRSSARGEGKGGIGGLRSFAGGLLLLLITGGMIIILGRSLPTIQIEGENMRHTSGVHFRNAEMNVWVLQENGTVWDNVVLPDKRDAYARILAAGQCNTGEAPHIVVSIGNEVIGEMEILYGKDSWIESNYTFKIPPMKRGMYSFSIELTNGRDDRRDGSFCGLYVDRIEFRRKPQ